MPVRLGTRKFCPWRACRNRLNMLPVRRRGLSDDTENGFLFGIHGNWTRILFWRLFDTLSHPKDAA